MDLLSGIGGCCASTEKVESVTRRDSSISLEDGASKRHTPQPANSPLVSFNLGIFNEPEGTTPKYGCLPQPSLPSSPSVVAPMDVYLRHDESHEYRMMKLSGTALQDDKQAFESRDMSPETSSWEFVDCPAIGRETPNTPVLQPELSPKSAALPLAKSSRPKGNRDSLSDSDISELALSVDSQSESVDTETYKEAVAGYRAASKRSKNVDPKTSTKRPRVYKDLRGRKHKREVGGEQAGEKA